MKFTSRYDILLLSPRWLWDYITALFQDTSSLEKLVEKASFHVPQVAKLVEFEDVISDSTWKTTITPILKFNEPYRDREKWQRSSLDIALDCISAPADLIYATICFIILIPLMHMHFFISLAALTLLASYKLIQIPLLVLYRWITSDPKQESKPLLTLDDDIAADFKQFINMVLIAFIPIFILLYDVSEKLAEGVIKLLTIPLRPFAILSRYITTQIYPEKADNFANTLTLTKFIREQESGEQLKLLSPDKDINYFCYSKIDSRELIAKMYTNEAKKGGYTQDTSQKHQTVYDKVTNLGDYYATFFSIKTNLPQNEFKAYYKWRYADALNNMRRADSELEQMAQFTTYMKNSPTLLKTENLSENFEHYKKITPLLSTEYVNSVLGILAQNMHSTNQSRYLGSLARLLSFDNDATNYNYDETMLIRKHAVLFSVVICASYDYSDDRNDSILKRESYISEYKFINNLEKEIKRYIDAEQDIDKSKKDLASFLAKYNHEDSKDEQEVLQEINNKYEQAFDVVRLQAQKAKSARK